MYLFIVLLWWSVVIGLGRRPNIVRNNSRLGGYASRLGERKFPIGAAREFAGNDLIWLAVCSAKRWFYGENRRNSRRDGKSRKYCPERWTPMFRRWRRSRGLALAEVSGHPAGIASK
jgi:hypothetical protein